jgi:hypothetical protein
LQRGFESPPNGGIDIQHCDALLTIAGERQPANARLWGGIQRSNLPWKQECALQENGNGKYTERQAHGQHSATN